MKFIRKNYGNFFTICVAGKIVNNYLNFVQLKRDYVATYWFILMKQRIIFRIAFADGLTPSCRESRKLKLTEKSHKN